MKTYFICDDIVSDHLLKYSKEIAAPLKVSVFEHYDHPSKSLQLSWVWIWNKKAHVIMTNIIMNIFLEFKLIYQYSKRTRERRSKRKACKNFCFFLILLFFLLQSDKIGSNSTFIFSPQTGICILIVLNKALTWFFFFLQFFNSILKFI